MQVWVKPLTLTLTLIPVQVWVKPQPGSKLAVYIVNPAPANLQAPVPLACFSKEAAADKKPNVCFGQYKIQLPSASSPEECAAECLQDSQCTQFVWGLPSEAGTKCRLSHTCTRPSSYLAGFDGYMRDSAKDGCGAPPSKPSTVSVPFSVLRLGGSSAGVRDIWAKKDVADATGSTLTATVAPMDSAFLLLTPK